MEKRWGASCSSGNGGSSHVGASSAPSAPKKTALLFPGSGSQYVGMISFLLKEFKVARETWEEAEHALSQFERWRKDLNLHELPDLKHLDLPNWPTWQKERSEKELRQIVLKGPQVRTVP
jgi:acyl transferase domain-containing protein